MKAKASIKGNEKKIVESFGITNKSLFYTIALIIFATLIFAYSNHYNNGFHFDDSHTIQNNVYINSLKNLPAFFTDPKTTSSMPSHQGYRPIVTTTLAVDYWLGGGLKPFYFQLSTFIWYIVQCLLMFFIILKIFNLAKPHPWNHYFALFASGWYALHTANAETVNYIISRSDTLSTFFIVAAFAIFIYFPLKRKYLLYLIPVILGLLTKEATAVFPALLLVYIMLFVYDVSFLNFLSKSKINDTGKSLLLAIPSIIITFIVVAYVLSMNGKLEANNTSTYQYVISQPFVILRYFLTFFVPINLSADSDWTVLKNIYDIKFIIGFLFLILIVYFGFKTSKNKETRPIAFGIVWFLVTLMPTSLVPLSEITNDHRMFLPFVGLTISVSWYIALQIIKYEKSISNKIIFLFAGASFVLLGNAVGTFHRNQVWLNEETLWLDVTQKSPMNGRGLMNYGLTQMAKGNYPEAQIYFEKALVYSPYYTFLHINIGVLKAAINKPLEAEESFKKGIQYGSTFNEPYYFYGKFLADQNRQHEAVPMLQKSIELSPGFIDARYTLMRVYNDMEKWDELRAIAEQTLTISKNDQTAINYINNSNTRKTKIDTYIQLTKTNPSPENFLSLSLLYYNKKMFKECIDACNDALKLNPNYAEAYNNICSAYNAMEMWDEAIIAGEKAVKLNPNYQLSKNNLNWAIQQKAAKKK